MLSCYQLILVTSMRFVFFGTPDIAVTCLQALVESGQKPALVVTQPDRPAGRGNVLTPPAVKVYAQDVGIEVCQIEKVTDACIDDLRARGEWDCFVLVAFGMILPQKLLDLPRKGTINMHPSLLPKLRGPSPIRTALRTNARDACGVTIMLIDDKMDHGPILAQRSYDDIAGSSAAWPVMGKDLDVLLSRAGGELLAKTVPAYIAGTILPQEQDHGRATYCKYIEKAHAEISLHDDPYENYLKICAYDGWPSAYTYVQKGSKQVRVKIVTAHLEGSGASVTLGIDRCVPEGKKETLWKDYVQNA
jgi:methionyl-tRNA formyltransferase